MEFSNAQLMFMKPEEENSMFVLTGEMLITPNYMRVITKPSHSNEHDLDTFAKGIYRAYTGRLLLRCKGIDACDLSTVMTTPVYWCVLSSTKTEVSPLQLVAMFEVIEKYSPEGELDLESIGRVKPEHEHLGPDFILKAIRPKACHGCPDYIGKSYGHEQLVCGIHATGPDNKNYCPDNPTKNAPDEAL